jgi:molybdopterin molybdotransferase
MIDVTEAKKIIGENTHLLTPATVQVKDAVGMVLADDVFSPIDMPAFRQASMDGYALSFEGWKMNKRLKIQGIVQAGLNNDELAAPQNAMRIFTGAVVPAGADTVVMQEKCRIDTTNDSAGELIIEDETLVPGINVRLKGSEIKTGDSALTKGCLLTPAAVGFLMGIGVTEVKVYSKPVISIIVTGNELQQPGQPLQQGQVYESNSYTLKAVLKQFHLDESVKVFTALDNLDILTEVLKQRLEQSDVVFLAGGVSAGDFDFVPQACELNGITKIFHKIKQKPGKPFYFGKKDQKYIFGLPGNPASVLTCFYEYVLPALGKMSNRHYELKKQTAPLAKKFNKPAGLTHFLKGFFDGNTVTALDAQESFRLSSFARANCLIQINEPITETKAGEMVEIHLLPFN